MLTDQPVDHYPCFSGIDRIGRRIRTVVKSSTKNRKTAERKSSLGVCSSHSTIPVGRNCSGACSNLEKTVWLTGPKNDWAKVQSNKNKNSAALHIQGDFFCLNHILL